MTGSFWVNLLIGVVVALALAWVALLIALVTVRPRGGLLREALRILPDALRLLRRLAADRSLPRGVRIRLWLVLAYLASPVDLIPDFIPVIGYADDAGIVAAALRSVIRAAGVVNRSPVRSCSVMWPAKRGTYRGADEVTGGTAGAPESGMSV
ncbi:MAG: DUF1232 domain-containing protein [Nocardia sp.]|nr:DUF1232 domain-containing protein [Nocardia sp.]